MQPLTWCSIVKLHLQLWGKIETTVCAYTQLNLFIKAAHLWNTDIGVSVVKYGALSVYVYFLWNTPVDKTGGLWPPSWAYQYNHTVQVLKDRWHTHRWVSYLQYVHKLMCVCWTGTESGWNLFQVFETSGDNQTVTTAEIQNFKKLAGLVGWWRGFMCHSLQETFVRGCEWLHESKVRQTQYIV